MSVIVKPKIAILKNEDPFDHESWVAACKTYSDQLVYKVIDLTTHDWLVQISQYEPDYCVLKPSGKTELYRSLYQERIDVLVNDLGIKVFPTFPELKIYENKKFFAYWAQANNIPHPTTWVFYHEKEAQDFLSNARLPIVAKKNLGASGNGVKIIKNRDDLASYVKTAYSVGIGSRTGPKLSQGQLLSRLYNKLVHPKELVNRLSTYKAMASDKQKGYLILQQYVPHEYEWRAVRIGDSFFAHKKMKKGDKASGSLLKNYDGPPLELLDFVRDLTERFGFYSVAVDVFEDDTGYLVNEIQCIFGQSDSFQMMLNGRTGRYVKSNSVWVFEEGDFAVNACYNLRLDWVLRHFEPAR